MSFMERQNVTNIQAVIFDLGGVVIEWNPATVYREMFSGDQEKVDDFLTRICNQDWNEQQDAGRSTTEGTAELVAKFPEWEKEIRAFYGRWIEMIRGPIPGTAAILDELAARGMPLYALSNWSAELFPLVRYKYREFDLFKKIFLSGDYGLIKPDERYYRIALREIGLPVENLIFIDDNPTNVAGAERLGLKSLLFKNADRLRADLIAAGIAL